MKKSTKGIVFFGYFAIFMGLFDSLLVFMMMAFSGSYEFSIFFMIPAILILSGINILRLRKWARILVAFPTAVNAFGLFFNFTGKLREFGNPLTMLSDFRFLFFMLRTDGKVIFLLGLLLFLNIKMIHYLNFSKAKEYFE